MGVPLFTNQDLICIFSDVPSQRVVRNVRAECNEGSITWTNTIGDLRIILYPGYNTNFRTCFSLDTKYAVVKVSEEKNPKPYQYRKYRQSLSSSTSLRTLALVKNRTKEYCISSSSEPIVLYLESTSSKYPSGIKRVIFHYVIETRRKPSVLKFNPMKGKYL